MDTIEDIIDAAIVEHLNSTPIKTSGENINHDVIKVNDCPINSD